MKHNRVLAVLIAAVLLAGLLNVGAAAAEEENIQAYWPSFRGIEALKGITDAKTPVTPEETQFKWQFSMSSGWYNSMGAPVEVGAYVYIACNDKIVKLDKKTGTPLLQGNLLASIGFFSTITYADGMIFVPISNGRIQAFDAQTLTSLWVTGQLTDNAGNSIPSLQSLSPITAHDGYLYMGVSNGNGTAGAFYCVSAEDENPNKPDEIKDFTWTYLPPYSGYYDGGYGRNGFYWSEGVVVGERIIFAGEAGELISHDLTNGGITDTFVLSRHNASIPEAVRSSLCYDRQTKRIFVSTKGGSIHSIKINGDGSFNRASYLMKNIANELTSSPTVYNGRLYVGGDGISAGAPFTVMDAETLAVHYQIDIHTQSSPIVTTAYATEENGQAVYIYALKYSGNDGVWYGSYDPDAVYCIKDQPGQTAPDYQQIAVSPVVQQNASSVSVGVDGTLYYKNDSGTLFAFGNANNAFTAQDVENTIRRLPALPSIETADKSLISLAKFRFDALPDSEKAKVLNREDLTNAIARLEELQDTALLLQQLIAEIELLPPVEAMTLADADRVLDLWQMYEELPALDKPSVSNLQKLTEARVRIGALRDEQAVSELIKQIDSLPTDITMSNKTAVYNAFYSYDALDTALQEQVTNAAALLELREKIDTLATEIQAINDAIWALDPENITVNDREAVEDIIARYNALPAADRALILYYDEVLVFRAEIDRMLAQQNQPGGVHEDETGTHPASKNPNTGAMAFSASALLLSVSIGILALFRKHRNESSADSR